MSTPYATPDGLVAEFGERQIIDLTDIEVPREGDLNYSVAQRACDRANAEVAANIAARYAAPLAPVPHLLVSTALDLAHLYLYQSDPPIWVQSRFDQAQATLRAVRDGKIKLGPDATGADVPGTSTDLAEFNLGSKVWGRGAF